jgi:hypothetical protein
MFVTTVISAFNQHSAKRGVTWIGTKGSKKYWRLTDFSIERDALCTPVNCFCLLSVTA